MWSGGGTKQRTETELKGEEEVWRDRPGGNVNSCSIIRSSFSAT